MQRRHPNRAQDLRGAANWQERNERAYWGSDEHDLPHYDDVLMPDDERDVDLHEARERRPGERFEARRDPASAQAHGGRGPRGHDDAAARRPAYPSERERFEDHDERDGRTPRLGRHGERHAGHGAPSYARLDSAPVHHVHPARNAERNAPRLRGPKGYTRSDERIREDVCERLAYAVDVDVSEVTVAVTQACVLLEGTVPDRWMKHEIEDLAASCVWVADVENRVRVSRGVRADDAARAGQGAGQVTGAAAGLPDQADLSDRPDAAARPSGAIGPGGPGGAAESGMARGASDNGLRDTYAPPGSDARRH